MGKPYRPGRHIVVCQRSGRECYDDDVRREWDGTIVYRNYFEPRNPQDLIRVRPERGAVYPNRPIPPAQYVTLNVLSAESDDDFLFAESPQNPDSQISLTPED